MLIVAVRGVRLFSGLFCWVFLVGLGLLFIGFAGYGGYCDGCVVVFFYVLSGFGLWMGVDFR
ncbi:hypothetical protein, partial [Rhizobium brockwellii]|uniref:hypothetical protein n=1 Tax=Rhizobium brockwellii TaxID=3019932 RepID=UPI003F9852DE